MAKATQSPINTNGAAPAELDVSDIQEALDLLNERAHAKGITTFSFGIAKPTDFIAAPLNAHFMRDETFRQLVHNIRQDGNLSSFPLAYHEDGKIYTIDGHHRVEAAKNADVPWMFYIYLDRGVDDDERIARQLAANAIVGEDDEQKLLALWTKIGDMDMKLYSGLDEKRFKMYQPVNLKQFADKALTFKTIELMFLPNEIEHVRERLDGIGKSNRARFVGALDQYAPIAEAFMQLKEATNVYNSAAAFMVMLEASALYCEWLEDVGSLSQADWYALHQTLVERGLAEPLEWNDILVERDGSENSAES